MLATGRTADAQWIEVEYEGQTGWISALYVQLTYNDRTIEIETIEIQSTPTQTPTGTLVG
jgi:uncharacterized protein YraI